MTQRRMNRRAVAALGGALVLAPLAPADAQTTTLSLDVQGGAGYSTNPFLVNGDDTGSAFSEILFQPQLTQGDALGDASLIARYRRTDYLDRYDSADSYGAELRARRKLSPLVTARAGLVYDSSILGQGTFGTIGVIDPTAPPAPGTPDIALLGLRQRQKSLVASIGADWQLSALDSANTQASVTRLDYGGIDSLTSSRTVAASVGYSRSLSSRTSIGVQGSGSWIDFARRGYSGTTYQPQLTLDHQLTETIHVSLAAGALFVTSNTQFGTSRSTGFSGSFFGCKRGDRDTGCLRAYSDAQATGFGDVSRRLGGGADYTYQLAENDTVRVSAEYSRIKATSALLQAPTSSFVSANGAFEHSFSRKLIGGVSGGYRDVTGGGLDRKSDITGKVYVRVTIGGMK